MGLTLRYGTCSLLGNYRENNEDAVAVKNLPGVTVCIVADGMGGQAAGEKASQMATEVIPIALQGLETARTPEEIRRIIRHAIVQANQEIISVGHLDRDFRNMGTTVVAAVWCPAFREDCMFITGVGDSRAYLARDGSLKQLTTDHSLAQALVEAKTISAEEARDHRFRNVLWKYLGSQEVGEGPDVENLFTRPGDRLLLCTDGLTGVVPDDQLLQGLSNEPDPQRCADALCQLALDMGSRDNVSAIVIDVVEG